MGCNHVNGNEFVYVACKDCQFLPSCNSIMKEKIVSEDFCILGNIPGSTECCDCVEDCEYRGVREPTDEEMFADGSDE